MLSNYLLISLRSILRHKLFSFINVGGLALGLAATWFIALHVGHELSYDRHHEHADRIFRIAQHAEWDGGTFNGAITPVPYGAAMKADFPEVDEFVRIDAEGGGTFVYNNKEFIVGDVLNVDRTFFRIFSATQSGNKNLWQRGGGRWKNTAGRKRQRGDLRRDRGCSIQLAFFI